MTEINQQIQTQETQFSEFSYEIPNAAEVEKLGRQFENNRNLLRIRAREFGLRGDFLDSQQTAVVGPFVNPSPITTTYDGKLENLSISLATTEALAGRLESIGYKTAPSTVVALKMTEITMKGNESMDSMIVPKNLKDNQRISLSGRNTRRTAYSSVTVTRDDVERQAKRIRETSQIEMERKPDLKRRDEKKIRLGTTIADAIITDLYEALESAADRDSNNLNPDEEIPYLSFANAVNAKILKRVFPETKNRTTYIDTDYYSPFITDGIEDIHQFIQKIKTTGFFKDNPRFIKVIGENGKVRTLSLRASSGKDALLQFSDDQSTITFSELKASQATIAPCKELSYLLCFSTMVPVLYGSQNSGGYYPPYAVAKEQVKKLGLTPTLYRIQPKISGKYNERDDTIFDFYERSLLQELP